MGLVCIEHKSGATYPKHSFDPGENYPEYPFGDHVSDESNDAYALVRDCLADMGLDAEHYGQPSWNPLGGYIKPGDRVVVKPNLVMHENENRSGGGYSFECLITHPSCIRAICDYCLIALKGTGKLLIGDAPMQGCDFQALLDKSGLAKIVEFYAANGYDVAIKDFRQYQSEFNRSKVIVGKRFTEAEGVKVCLGEKSAHGTSPAIGDYQVSDYDKAETARYHHDGVHDYEIARDILEADVVINFCKPKTHRLAGFTGAMKNMVGITYNKASLPHRRAGSQEEGGDAYLHKSLLKKLADEALTHKVRAENKGRYGYATFLRYMYGAFLVPARKFGKDSYYIGSWYGNDTIWRTICDLNHIVRYADKKGDLQCVPQRAVLNFGDMIIAGERNGPVSPQPKLLGCIVGSTDEVAFDAVLCRLMGFTFDSIPLMRNIAGGKTAVVYEEPSVLLRDDTVRQERRLSRTEFDSSWHFEPHDAWKEVESAGNKGKC